MPRYQAAKILESDRTALGIVVPATDTDARSMVFGASSPIPPRASKTTSTGGGEAQTVTTFYDSTKALPAGWTSVKLASSSGMTEF